MNQTSKLLFLAIAIFAVVGILTLAEPGSKPGGSPVSQTRPCSKQALPAPGVKTTEGFTISGHIVDNSERIVIGGETSSLLLVGNDGVAYELHFCDDAAVAQYARSLAGTPVRVSGTLLEKDEVETHARKILYADSVSPVLAQPQKD